MTTETPPAWSPAEVAAVGVAHEIMTKWLADMAAVKIVLQSVQEGLTRLEARLAELERHNPPYFEAQDEAHSLPAIAPLTSTTVQENRA